MLGRLISAFGAAALRSEIAALVGRIRLRIILTAVAGIFWLLAFAFLLATLAVWLSDWVGPLGACAILTLAFVVIALGIHVALYMLKRRRATPLTSVLSQAIAPLKAAADEMGEAGVKAADKAGEAAAQTPGSASAILLLLTAIGYALGHSLRPHRDQP